MKQPLLAVTLLYVSGILAAEVLSLPLWPVLAVSLVFAIAALSWASARLLLLCPILVLAGFANAQLHTCVLSPLDLRRLLGAKPNLVMVRGKLAETPSIRVSDWENEAGWRTQARMEVSALKLDKSDWQPVNGTLAIASPGLLTNFYAGQHVEVLGVAAPPPLPAAEGTFNYRNFLQQQGIYYLLRTQGESDWHLLDSSTGRSVSDRFVRWARGALALGLPGEDESLRLEWALTLGWKTALTEQTSEPFVRAATYHIFAVDGLRMAIVFGIFFTVLRAASLPRWASGLILAPLIWFYVAVTGWPASAIRASIMLTIILLGWVLKRPGNSLNSLFAAALLILLWQPQQLFQAGFQLSFIVVLSLLLITPPLFALMRRVTAPDPLLPPQLHFRPSRWLSVPGCYVGDVWVTSFAAWIGSVPLVAYYFNMVTPVSTPANLLAVPLCVLVLISNLISLALAGWFPAAAELFNHAGWFGMECIRVSSEWFANWPAAYFYTAAPTLFTTCLYYALLLGLITGWFFRPAFRLRKIAAVSIAILIWSCTFWQQATTTRLSVLPVNGGMAVYCDSPGRGRDLLIDTGPSNSVQFITKSFLRAQGVNRLPALLLSHGDVHHTGGAESIVELFNVPRVYTSPVRFRSAGYRQMLTHFESKPGLLGNVSRNEKLGDWTVLHPQADDRFSKADDGAIVLKAQLGKTRVLLLSDLGQDGQVALVQRNPDLCAEIVVTGLPATGEALGQPLLQAVQPKLIIVADSEFPFAERATPRLRARLVRQKAPVVYTSEAGSVTLEFRKNEWRLRTINGQTLRSIDLPNATP